MNEKKNSHDRDKMPSMRTNLKGGNDFEIGNCVLLFQQGGVGGERQKDVSSQRYHCLSSMSCTQFLFEGKVHKFDFVVRFWFMEFGVGVWFTIRVDQSIVCILYIYQNIMCIQFYSLARHGMGARTNKLLSLASEPDVNVK